MKDLLRLYEIEMLEHQRLVGECLRSMLLLDRTGPAVDELADQWDALEAFRDELPA